MKLYEVEQKRYEEYRLFGDSQLVSPVTVDDIVYYADKCADFYEAEGCKSIEKLERDSPFVHRSMNIGKTAISLLDSKNKFNRNPKHNNDEILLKLNLLDRTDKELLDELRLLLPEWRKKCGLIEPESRFIKGRTNDIDKIRNYRPASFDGTNLSLV